MSERLALGDKSFDVKIRKTGDSFTTVSYTHLRAQETEVDLV